jgi:ethanolamine utilization protein EutN
MILAKVIGHMVATRKEAVYEGRKILWVQPISPEGEDLGQAFLTLDAVGAGAGEQVLVIKEGSGAMQVLGLQAAPVSSAIVGIVDQIEMQAPGGA